MAIKGHFAGILALTHNYPTDVEMLPIRASV